MPVAKKLTGLTASSSPTRNKPFVSPVTGLMTPNFVAAHSGGPTNGNKPPMIAPSAPKRNLFLKFAIASSLPLKFVVSS